MKPEESHLVKACRRKDRRAQKELYELFAPSMFTLCLRYTHTDEDAMDVMHDGFIKAFDNIDQLRSGDSLTAWMKSIMVNTAISHLRREKRYVDVDIADESLSHFTAYDDNAFDEIDIELIMKAIRQLPTRQRVVFNMVELEGYTYEEVAEQLGITSSAVRSNLMRAKRLLVEQLAPLKLNN
ncbi:MAG: RNA polymerase sigma factor [Bacteroidales bacterium]|nr:RNA polymerase sigma factor [Bacteroidales bacterium]